MNAAAQPCPATVYSRCLWRAARISGDTGALAAYLGVPHAQLIDWMTDVEVPPQEVFHKAVDLVVGVDAVLDVSELAAFLARSKLPITLPGQPPAPNNEGAGPHSQ
jgi:hypothetical protein